jgi:hypothetical protein
LVPLHLAPVLLPLGNDRFLTRHVDLDSDADRLLATLRAAVGHLYHDTCAGYVCMKAIQALDSPPDQSLKGLGAIHVLECNLQRSFHRLLRS